MEYTAIIGVHNGAMNVPEILSALENQTVKPHTIVIWDNCGDSHIYKVKRASLIPLHTIKSDFNYGCFSRFAAGLFYPNEYVMVLDDDTIPGVQWAENCINTEKQIGPAVLGCRGIILTQKSYSPFKEAGIAVNNNIVQQCDLVGHSWFFKRRYLSFMFNVLPLNYYNGEDIHLSAVAQKSLNVNTFCPPQPANKPELWGSTRRKLGTAPGRISTKKDLKTHFQERGEVVKYWIKNGWEPLFMKEYKQ